MDGATLDQLEVFITVAEEGSFSAAARRLHRAQSAVSYAVATLEGGLDVQLFDRSGRTPVLTDAGTALLKEARSVVVHAEQLKARAKEIAGGTEAQLSIAVDVFFPMPILLDTLHCFQAEYPRVSLRLYTEALGSVVSLVEEKRCQLGISAPLPQYPGGLSRSPMLKFPMVCVCAPGHPLAQESRPISEPTLRKHTQLILTDRSNLTAGVDMGTVAGASWRLADLSAKHELLRAGFGWGSMPRHMVEGDLGRGELVELETESLSSIELTLHLVKRDAEWVGPATQWLIEQLKTSCQRFEQETSSQAAKIMRGQTPKPRHPSPPEG
ncbi:MAG: LysR family transcriptional regulator [Myxococcota bacterium]